MTIPGMLSALCGESFWIILNYEAPRFQQGTSALEAVQNGYLAKLFMLIDRV